MFAQRGDAVDEEFAFKVVKLVLHHSGKIALHPFLVGSEVLVKITDFDAGGATHRLVDAGQTQTPLFGNGCFRVVIFQNVGVDVGTVEVSIFGKVVFQHVKSDDNHANRLADLWGSESDSVAVVHGLKHVANQLLEVGKVGGDVFRFFAEHGHAVGING